MNPLTHRYIQVIGNEVISEFPDFPGLQEDSHCGFCLSVCLSMTWAYWELCGLIYIITLRLGLTHSYRSLSLYVPLYYLVTNYRTWPTNHGVVSFLYKPCSASAYVNTGFINPLNVIDHPVIVKSKKGGGRKKYLFSKTKK